MKTHHAWYLIPLAALLGPLLGGCTLNANTEPTPEHDAAPLEDAAPANDGGPQPWWYCMQGAFRGGECYATVAECAAECGTYCNQYGADAGPVCQ